MNQKNIPHSLDAVSASDDLESQIACNERKIRGLEVLIESLDRQTLALFEQEGVKPNLITRYLSDRSRFSDEQWRHIEAERAGRDETLQRSLSEVTDPRKKKKSRSNLNVLPYWIPVR